MKADNTLRLHRTVGDTGDLAIKLHVVRDGVTEVAPDAALVVLTVGDPSGSFTLSGVSAGQSDGSFSFAVDANLGALPAGDYPIDVEVTTGGSTDTWAFGILQNAAGV